jgi:hypothetical protein
MGKKDADKAIERAVENNQSVAGMMSELRLSHAGFKHLSALSAVLERKWKTHGRG